MPQLMYSFKAEFCATICKMFLSLEILDLPLLLRLTDILSIFLQRGYSAVYLMTQSTFFLSFFFSYNQKQLINSKKYTWFAIEPLEYSFIECPLILHLVTRSPNLKFREPFSVLESRLISETILVYDSALPTFRNAFSSQNSLSQTCYHHIHSP